MNYKIRKGSVVIAFQQGGQSEAKTVTRERIYRDAIFKGGAYIFNVKPGGLYARFAAQEHDVEVTPDILALQDGTYTIVFDGGFPPANDRLEEEFQEKRRSYVTIRLETGKCQTQDGQKNFFFGKQIVSFLTGPDNENNFTGFAHLDENGGLHVWKKFREGNAVKKYEQALNILASQDIKGQGEAGLEYAMRSGRCYRCGRTLTVPASLHAGMGPVCRAGGTDE